MSSHALPNNHEADAEESADEVVRISRVELEALQERASRFSPELPPSDSPEEKARSRDIEEQNRRVADLEKKYKEAVRDRELATALAGRPLVPGAAAQLVKLLRDDFDVYESEGEYRVSARDGRPLGRAIAERLADPEYSHFCLPSSRGGASPQGPNRASGPAAPAAPKTLGEAALQRWREAAAGRANSGSAPIGLRRR